MNNNSDIPEEFFLDVADANELALLLKKSNELDEKRFSYAKKVLALLRSTFIEDGYYSAEACSFSLNFSFNPSVQNEIEKILKGPITEGLTEEDSITDASAKIFNFVLEANPNFLDIGEGIDELDEIEEVLDETLTQSEKDVLWSIRREFTTERSQEIINRLDKMKTSRDLAFALKFLGNSEFNKILEKQSGKALNPHQEVLQRVSEELFKKGIYRVGSDTLDIEFDFTDEESVIVRKCLTEPLPDKKDKGNPMAMVDFAKSVIDKVEKIVKIIDQKFTPLRVIN